MSFLQTMVGKISATATRVARLDPAYNAIVNVPSSIHDVHAGEFFMFRRSFYLSKNAVLDLLLACPNTSTELHFHLSFEGVEGAFNVKLYGGTTVSANGTDLSSQIINHNFRSSNTSILDIYQAPTITDLGNLGGEGNYGASKKFGGEGTSQNEFILPNNMNMLTRVTNGSAVAQYVNVAFHWSQKTPLN